MSAFLSMPPATALPYEPLYEVVNGNRVEVQPTASLSNEIATQFVRHIANYLDEKPGMGRVVGEGLFKLELKTKKPTQRRPDVAYLSVSRYPLEKSLQPEGDYPVPPEIAVEIVSRHDNVPDLFGKIGEYFRGGVDQVWLVLSVEQLIHVYESPKKVTILGVGDTLTTPILPGFKVAVKKLFPAA